MLGQCHSPRHWSLNGWLYLGLYSAFFLKMFSCGFICNAGIDSPNPSKLFRDINEEREIGSFQTYEGILASALPLQCRFPKKTKKALLFPVNKYRKIARLTLFLMETIKGVHHKPTGSLPNRFVFVRTPIGEIRNFGENFEDVPGASRHVIEHFPLGHTMRLSFGEKMT